MHKPSSNCDGIHGSPNCFHKFAQNDNEKEHGKGVTQHKVRLKASIMCTLNKLC